MRLIGLLVIVWLVVGAVAAVQRGYFTHATQNCASAGTIAVTVIAGPSTISAPTPRSRTVMCPSPVDYSCGIQQRANGH